MTWDYKRGYAFTDVQLDQHPDKGKIIATIEERTGPLEEEIETLRGELAEASKEESRQDKDDAIQVTSSIRCREQQCKTKDPG